MCLFLTPENCARQFATLHGKTASLFRNNCVECIGFKFTKVDVVMTAALSQESSNF